MKIEVLYKWTAKELRDMGVFVLVECYRWVQESGSTRRKYELLFTKEEREVINAHRKVFATWMLGRWDSYRMCRASYGDGGGMPDSYHIHPVTLKLLIRAIKFYADA